MNKDKEELCDLYSSPNIVWVIKKNGGEMDRRGMWHVRETEILKKWDRGMDWIDLARNGDRLRSVVNTVVNF
jgi:hypothetical protein